jgi:excisionase family DNA binding protein
MNLDSENHCGERSLRVHIVAKRLNRSRRMVRHLAQTGELHGFKIGLKLWAFRPQDVDAYRRKLEDLNAV